MASNIPITNGQGQSSVAAEEISSLKYQQIKVVGGDVGSTSVWGINPDRSAQVSVVGTISANVSGSVFATLSGAGSIITVLQSSSIIGVVTGSVVAIPTGNQSVSGAVNVSGSVLLGSSNASVVTYLQNSSILAVPVGSVITVWKDSSVLAVPTGNQSVSGTVGASVLGNVNTTVTSVAASEGFLRFAPPVGATIQGIADLQVVQGTSVTVIAAQGASVFSYIRGVQVTNFGSASVLVRLGGGLGSTLGWTIAPAGGGSNIVYPDGLKTGANSAFTASISGTASVLVSAQGFTAKI